MLLSDSKVHCHLFPAEVPHNFFLMLPFLNFSLFWVASLSCLGVLLGVMSQNLQP